MGGFSSKLKCCMYLLIDSFSHLTKLHGVSSLCQAPSWVLGIYSEQKQLKIPVPVEHLEDRNNKEISKIYRMSGIGRCRGGKQDQGGIISGPGP